MAWPAVKSLLHPKQSVQPALPPPWGQVSLGCPAQDIHRKRTEQGPGPRSWCPQVTQLLWLTPVSFWGLLGGND